MAKTAKQALAALPSVIRIGPINASVLTDPPEDGEADAAYGYWLSGKEELWLNPEITSPQRVVETFTHELLHALYDNAALMDTDDEERTVTVLSRGLIAFYRDNPWYGKWIATYAT